MQPTYQMHTLRTVFCFPNHGTGFIVTMARFCHCAASHVVNEGRQIRPFSEIPGPTGLPVIGTLLSAAKNGALKNQLHEYFAKRYREYGPIYREKLGDYSAVFIHEPADVRELFRHEGRYPRRTQFEAWEMYREEANKSPGVALA